MADPRIDGRPRILDFSARPEDVRARRDVGWPCHAFRVMVPVQKPGRLNLFEETVLRLLDNAHFDETQLAKTTCLDPSVVRLVCCRLRDLNMITEANKVTDVGRVCLDRLQSDATDYEVRWVFRELLGGTLLPVVYGGKFRYEELADWNGQSRVAAILKKHGRATLRLLRRQQGLASHAPRPDDVARAARRHRELGQQYALMRRGVPPCPPVAGITHMNVDPAPEPVFLRCAVVIPASSDEFQITDPFGYGYSAILLGPYEGRLGQDEAERQFLDDLRKQAITLRSGRPGPASEGEAEERAVLARLGESIRDHGELFADLRNAERDLRRSERPPRSADEEAHFRYQAHQAAQHLAAAVEAALAIVAARCRPAVCEALLRGQSPDMNRALIEGFARRVGLALEGIGSLLQVPGGRIRELREGDVDMQALVAIVLAAASEDDDHPLRRLAVRFPDWLVFLVRLKRMRDAGAHGQSRKAAATELGWLRDQAYRTLLLLLPRLERAGTDEAVAAGPAPSSMGAVHDARILAIVRLERRFGIQWKQGLDRDAAEIFIQVELAASAWDPADADRRLEVTRAVADLASALQALVRRRCPPSSERPLAGADPRRVATTRAVEAGLLQEEKAMPAELARVNPRRVAQALQGASPSLGANVVALLLLAPMDWLRGLAGLLPTFLAVCECILELRGHGNRPVFLRPEEARALKNDIYSACSALMEA